MISLLIMPLLFVLIVVLGAAVWGVWPGLLLAALSVIVLDWCFLSPSSSLRVEAAADAALLVVYAGVAVTSAGVVGVLRRWWSEQHVRAQRAEGMVLFLDRQLDERDAELHARSILSFVNRGKSRPSAN